MKYTLRLLHKQPNNNTRMSRSSIFKPQSVHQISSFFLFLPADDRTKNYPIPRQLRRQGVLCDGVYTGTMWYAFDPSLTPRWTLNYSRPQPVVLNGQISFPSPHSQELFQFTSPCAPAYTHANQALPRRLFMPGGRVAFTHHTKTNPTTPQSSHVSVEVCLSSCTPTLPRPGDPISPLNAVKETKFQRF